MCVCVCVCNTLLIMPFPFVTVVTLVRKLILIVIFYRLPSEIDKLWQKTWNSSEEEKEDGNNDQWSQLEAIVQWDPFKGLHS